MQVATLNDAGALHVAVPIGVTHAVMEIGCSDRDTLDEQWLPSDPSAFLISFEPLLDKFAVLLSRGTARFHGAQRDRAVRLGFHHRRGVVLPLAVTPHGGPVADFKVSVVAGCSSVLAVNQSTSWGRWCTATNDLETRHVPSISMSTALDLAGELQIRRLNIDAQGFDFALVRSVPPALLRARVQSVQMELIAPGAGALYHGQETCDERWWTTCGRSAMAATTWTQGGATTSGGYTLSAR